MYAQKLPTRFAPSRNDKEIELTEVVHNANVKEENRIHVKSARSNYRRGRGGREQRRGKKLQKRVNKVNNFKSSSARKNVRGNENATQGLRQLGRRTLGQGGGRGRRTIRKRRAENRVVEETLQGRMAETHSSPESGGESPRNLDVEWDDEKIDEINAKDDNANSAEAVESDDNAPAEEYEQRNWDLGFDGVSSRWNGDMMEASDEDVDASEDDDDDDVNGVEEVGDGDSVGEMDASEGSEGIQNRIENDEGSESAVSDDYSD